MFVHGSGDSSGTATNRTVPSSCGLNIFRSGAGTIVAGLSAEIKARRRKIAGKRADVLTVVENATATTKLAVGQPGVGRQYSRRMGIVRINNTQYSSRTFVNVSVGSTAVFQIRLQNWDDFERSDFADTEVNLTDLERLKFY